MTWQRTNLLILLVFSYFASVDLLSPYPIILIVSYDAFRYDYPTRGKLSNRLLYLKFVVTFGIEILLVFNGSRICESHALLFGNIFITPQSVLAFSAGIFTFSPSVFSWLGFTPVLAKLRESGTVAEYMDNVFVTKTFTNHHSIATGVYPEFHGVLGNSLYDSYYKKKLGYSYELWHYSNDTLPIWVSSL